MPLLPWKPEPTPPAATLAAQPPPGPVRVEREGTLRIAVVPWAEVEVDGVKFGVSPPLKPLALSAGTHVVRLLNPAYAPFRRKVTIQPGEATTLSVDLPKEAFPR